MALLQYTSKEMYSSTELIRKSKMVFDKLNTKEIEKAIILRDGKPSFMLLDFEKYETVIGEYLSLQDKVKDLKNELNQLRNQNNSENITIQEKSKKSDISSDDLEEALAKIEELDLELPQEILPDIIVEENETLTNKEETKEKQPLKDFWD